VSKCQRNNDSGNHQRVFQIYFHGSLVIYFIYFSDLGMANFRNVMSLIRKIRSIRPFWMQHKKAAVLRKSVKIMKAELTLRPLLRLGNMRWAEVSGKGSERRGEKRREHDPGGEEISSPALFGDIIVFRTRDLPHQIGGESSNSNSLG
jgi:hypothetical protein